MCILPQLCYITSCILLAIIINFASLCMYVCMYVCMCVYVGYLKPKKVDELFPWVSDLLASVEGSVHSESRWSAEGTHSLASNC